MIDTVGRIGDRHILLVALPDEVLLNDTEELTYVGIALDHVLEALQPVNLYQLLLEHRELLDLLGGDCQVVLGLLQMNFSLRSLRLLRSLLPVFFPAVFIRGGFYRSAGLDVGRLLLCCFVTLLLQLVVTLQLLL